MATQLLMHERIETTLPKAKELRKTADNLITWGKQVPCDADAVQLAHHIMMCM